MRSIGYERGEVHFVQVRVEDTLPQGAPKKIALLRLNTDFYESTKHELECLFPRLVAGGVLIIDDYGYWKGARKGVDEFFLRHDLHPLLTRIDDTGRLLVVYKEMVDQ